MNDQTFLQRLFNGYVNLLGEHRWHDCMKDSDATQEEIGRFRNLGMMPAYIPVGESTGDAMIQ